MGPDLVGKHGNEGKDASARQHHEDSNVNPFDVVEVATLQSGVTEKEGSIGLSVVWIPSASSSCEVTSVSSFFGMTYILQLREGLVWNGP
jgi:hypothetical protein